MGESGRGGGGGWEGREEKRNRERDALFEHDQIFKSRLNGADPSGNKAFKIPFGLAREC